MAKRKADTGFTVTRQHQWPTGKEIVEVSVGGLDYTNPDALVGRYPGEFQTYLDPREAIETAIKIAQQWSKDSRKRIPIGVGATAGFTIPFETTSIVKARKWAKKVYAGLPKCAMCGELIEERFEAEGVEEAAFCSERCAEKAWQEAEEELEKRFGLE